MADTIRINTRGQGEPYVTISADGTEPTALGTDAISIGELATAGGNNSIAIGTSSNANSSGAVQISTGTNSTSDTLQFLTNRIANAQGLYTSFISPTNYSPIDVDNVTSHLQAIDTALSGSSYAETIGDNAASSFVVTHSLGTRDVLVQVYRNGTPYDQVFPTIEHTSTTTITVDFGATVPALDEFRVFIKS